MKKKAKDTSRRLRRLVVAEYRDLRILLREFWVSIVAFAGVMFGGAFILSHYYPLERLTFDQALYNTFTMLFFQPQLKLPEPWYLQLQFYLVPLVGLGLVVEGFTRFGVLVVNKQLRGEVWQRIVASTYSDHIIICGVGHIGFRVAEQLRNLGREFVVVALESKFLERLREWNVPVVVGDARDETLLRAANILQAKSIIVATDNDLANLEIAMTARELHPDIRIIVRLFDPEMGKKVQKALGIDMAFSTSTLTAPAVALGALANNVLHSFYVGKDLLSLAELGLGQSCRYCGRILEELEQQANITVVLVRSGDDILLHPKGDTVLQAGDVILFLGDLSTIEKLRTQGFRGPDDKGVTELGAATSGAIQGLFTDMSRPAGATTPDGRSNA